MAEVISPEIPNVEDCPALSRTPVYVVPGGENPIIEHPFKDKDGNPLNFCHLWPCDSEDSQSAGDVTGSTFMRMKEVVSPAHPCHNPVVEVEGEMVNPETGTAHYGPLDNYHTDRPGVYELSFAVKDGDTIVATDMSLMWIERSLFVDPMVDDTFHKGPPGVQNLRMALLDFPESNLLLDDYEFKIDQLMHALTWPVTTWNSTPPPLRPALDTRDFPFRNEWTQATCGILFRHAAHGYRRNHLPYSAGGVSVDDHNKETQYLQASELVLSEYKDFVRYKKLEINTSLCTGSVNSIYGGLFR